MDYILDKFKNYELHAILVPELIIIGKEQNIFGKTVVRYLESEKMKIKNSKIELFKHYLDFPHIKISFVVYIGIVKKKFWMRLNLSQKKRSIMNQPDILSISNNIHTKNFLRRKALFWIETC